MRWKIEESLLLIWFELVLLLIVTSEFSSSAAVVVRGVTDIAVFELISDEFWFDSVFEIVDGGTSFERSFAITTAATAPDEEEADAEDELCKLLSSKGFGLVPKAEADGADLDDDGFAVGALEFSLTDCEFAEFVVEPDEFVILFDIFFFLFDIN